MLCRGTPFHSHRKAMIGETEEGRVYGQRQHETCRDVILEALKKVQYYLLYFFFNILRVEEDERCGVKPLEKLKGGNSVAIVYDIKNIYDIYIVYASVQNSGFFANSGF